ncbi:uncharacterized protein B0H64DRAFT_450961 [Chaetomium fimeti]|uniref:Uncharacterized protein n=1 Tax=Chaetomium fimeti TaxID=1854472 RepID=A0AAE0H7J3_9PEZI|nr:hypothetical protein B0H64DRAFT_450961 [Chaetomium fimeti]
MCVHSLIALCDEAKGHIITRWVFTNAYIWCDDYVRSPNFTVSMYANPPNCPNGILGKDYEHYRSRTLCADCMECGCSLPTEKSSAYGFATTKALTTARQADSLARRTASSGVASTAKKNAPAPLRVIDLREDDAADIARLKRKAAKKKKREQQIRNSLQNQNILPSASANNSRFRIAKRPTQCEPPINRGGRAPLCPEDEALLDSVPLLVFDKSQQDEEGDDADDEEGDDADDEEGDDAGDEDEEGGNVVVNTYSLPVLSLPIRPRNGDH